MTMEALLEQVPELAVYVEHMPQEIRGRFTLRTYPAHSIIHQKHDVIAAFGIVCRGQHRVINEFENGNIFMIEKNRAISFLGEVTLLAGKTVSSVTIETLTECLVLYISLEDFHAWIAQDIGFLRLLTQSISAKLYSASYSRGERQYYSVRYLVLKYLLEQSGEGLARGQRRVVVRQTRQQMGEELGLTVKTLNRTITALRDDGLIGIEKGKISVTPDQGRRMREAAGVYVRQSKRRHSGAG